MYFLVLRLFPYSYHYVSVSVKHTHNGVFGDPMHSKSKSSSYPLSEIQTMSSYLSIYISGRYPSTEQTQYLGLANLKTPLYLVLLYSLYLEHTESS